MLVSLIFILVVSGFSTAKQIDVIKLPFVLTEKGDMILEDDVEKFSIDSQLVLTHKDSRCTTKVNFSRPTAEEVAAKSGYRTMIENCKDLPESAKKSKNVKKESGKQ
ncbi:unnamed protein product [Heterobilharzia americana]|nr:unnamed protein product [Heterobilharzia americana]